MRLTLLKLPLLLLSAYCYDISFGNPSALRPEDQIMLSSFREKMWFYIAVPCKFFTTYAMYLAAIAESMVILDSQCQSSGTLSVVLKALGPAEASRLTVPFFLGASLVSAGSAIRVRCFKALGPHFTVVQCIRKDHQLVTTGPYTVVRHPAYSSMLMCVIGVCVMQGSPSSWVRASGVLGVPWLKAMYGCWWLIMGASVVTLYRRSTDEDRLLSERFGKKWESWASRVKYKLVPFVY